MTFGSLFSGAGGADIGLEQAGLRTLWHCEIDERCNHVRRYHWPEVPSVADVRDFSAFDALPVPDVIWLSPPCQDLSVAGKREGLKGERSGLFYDAVRVVSGFVRRGTRFALMEQVPGLLSSHAGADFREVLLNFLGIGARDIAWAVLDSQWFGVPQRRRRVYFAVDFGGECAGEILALSYGLQRHYAPSRETGQGTPSGAFERADSGRGDGHETTPTGRSVSERRGREGLHRMDGDEASAVPEVAGSIGAHKTGGWGNDLDNQGAFIPVTSHSLNSKPDPQDPTFDTYVAHTLSADGFDASEDGTGRGTPIVPVCIKGAAIGRADTAGPQYGDTREDQSFCLQTNEVHAVAFTSKDHGSDAGDISPTLRSMGHDESHANGGGQVAVAIAENQRAELRFSDVSPQLSCAGGKPGSGYSAAMQSSSLAGWMDKIRA